VVVTDVRYPNEANMLRSRGFRLIRITRPGVADDQHDSETALDTYPADSTIENIGTVEQLREAILSC
jgi:hypothetical protein